MTGFIIAALALCIIFYLISRRDTIACIDVSGSVSNDAYKAAVRMARRHGHCYIMFYSSDYTRPQWFSRKLYNSIIKDDATPTIIRGGTSLHFLANDPYYKNHTAHIYSDHPFDVPYICNQKIRLHYVSPDATWDNAPNNAPHIAARTRSRSCYSSTWSPQVPPMRLSKLPRKFENS